MSLLKGLLTGFIFLFAALFITIIWNGGFEVHVWGKEISCRSLLNPIIFLSVFVFLRLALGIGGKNTLTLLMAILFSALLGEIMIRIINPPLALPALKNLTRPSHVLGYQMVPLLEDRKIRTNSHGLRDRERSWKKPDGIRRILGIGDSFTFGYEVEQEDCYLKQLERLLNHGDKKWDVINAGVSGYNMWQYLAYFEHYGIHYQPDIVTIGIFFDDFYGDPSSKESRHWPERYHSFRFFRLINFFRNAYDLLMFRYRHLLNASWLRSIEQRREYIRNSKDYLLLNGKATSDVYRKFESRLHKLISKAKTNHVDVMVLLIPDVVQLHHPELQVLNAILRDISQRCAVEFVDVTPIFESYPDIQELYLLPYDAHISPKGHGVIARELLKKIGTSPNFRS